jgi:hypothetical protein
MHRSGQRVRRNGHQRSTPCGSSRLKDATTRHGTKISDAVRSGSGSPTELTPSTPQSPFARVSCSPFALRACPPCFQ